MDQSQRWDHRRGAQDGVEAAAAAILEVCGTQAARVTVAMLQAGMLFQFGFDCCLVRYLLAALLERDGFVLVLRSRESFCVSLLLPHTCCVCRVRVHPGHRAGRICTCSTLQWSKHILGRPGSAPHGARGERNRGTT